MTKFDELQAQLAIVLSSKPDAEVRKELEAMKAEEALVMENSK